MPIVDGDLLPEEPGVVFARGEQHDVPYMTGGNSFEGTIYPAFAIAPSDFLASLGDRESEARRLYADDLRVGEQRGASRLFGDNRYLLSARYLAEQMMNRGSPAYLYFFSHRPEKAGDQRPGAAHGSETPLVFGLGDDLVSATHGESGRLLSDAMGVTGRTSPAPVIRTVTVCRAGRPTKRAPTCGSSSIGRPRFASGCSKTSSICSS